MTEVTFSVIMPTKGRRSLRGAVASVTAQLEPGDEVLIRCSRDDKYGNATRQSLIERARGTHLVFLDDDDQLAAGALVTMRGFAEGNPGRIGIFRMRYPDGRVLWAEPELRKGNVSDEMFCVPNVPDKLGRFVSKAPRNADFHFMQSTVKALGEPIFREEIVAHVHPEKRAIDRRKRVVKRLRAPTRALRRLANRAGL